MSKSKRCARCRFYKTAHGRDYLGLGVCVEFVQPAPLWLRIRTKVAGMFL